MASDTSSGYLSLRKLLDSGYRPVSIKISIQKSDDTIVKLKDSKGIVKSLKSSSLDFIKLAFSLNFSYDIRGVGFFG
jgi:hypothetical protein